MNGDHDTTAGRYDWERLVRRVRMNPSVKLVALAAATYASRDGSHIYPGVQRLAAVTGLTEKTVRVALRELREMGLLYRVGDGRKNRRRGHADEYQMRIPADLLTRCDLLPPDELATPADSTDPRSPELTTGEQPVDNPRRPPIRRPDHRNSVPRSPELSSASPELSSTFTGTQFPPPVQDQANNQRIDQRDDPVADVTTDRAGSDDVIDIFVRMAQRDRFR